MIRLPRSTRDPIRLGITGPGAVARSVYLALLARIPERYADSAVADLWASVPEAAAARHGVPERARFGRPDAMTAPLAGPAQGRRDIITCQVAAQRGLDLGGEAATHPDRMEARSH